MSATAKRRACRKRLSAVLALPKGMDSERAMLGIVNAPTTTDAA